MTPTMSLKEFKETDKRFLTSGWKLSRKVKINDVDYKVTGSDKTNSLIFEDSTGQDFELPIEAMSVIFSDLSELKVVPNPKEEAIKTLEIVRHFACQLPVVSGKEKEALSLIHVLDESIKAFTGK